MRERLTLRCAMLQKKKNQFMIYRYHKFVNILQHTVSEFVYSFRAYWQDIHHHYCILVFLETLAACRDSVMEQHLILHPSLSCLPPFSLSSIQPNHPRFFSDSLLLQGAIPCSPSFLLLHMYLHSYVFPSSFIHTTQHPLHSFLIT